MTASCSELTVRQQRIVAPLRPFFGAEADALYEANGRSLQKLTYFARQSTLPSFHRLVTGLTLAQELLVEELTGRSVFDAPAAVADFLKLHFAGQPHESFTVLYLDAQHGLIAFEELFRGTLTQMRISAIVDACFRPIVDGVSAPSWTRRGCAQAMGSMYLNRPRSV